VGSSARYDCWRTSGKKRGCRLANLTLAFLILGLSAAEPREFRVTETQPNDHPVVRALDYMSGLVSERTQGRHHMSVYPGGLLGEQAATFEQTRLGVIELNRTNMAPLSSFIGKPNILGLPFLFRSADHFHRIIDGAVGDNILHGLEPHGFVGLTFFESGARSVYTVKRPVRTIDDIKGLRIRLQQSDLMVDMFAALGAHPVIIPYTSVKTALATELIDAAENNWPSFVASDHYSVAPYFALTEHTMTPDVLIMSTKVWSSLSVADQNVFRNAAKDASRFLRGQWKDLETNMRKQARDLGVTITEIDQKPLASELRGLYTNILKDAGTAHLVESIQKDQ
jgi:tripartite ATP-independent transporter DctP family solute receptor